MTAKELGEESAFPSIFDDIRHNTREVKLGLTKREFFAALALLGRWNSTARDAVVDADALLEELAKS